MNTALKENTGFTPSSSCLFPSKMVCSKLTTACPSHLSINLILTLTFFFLKSNFLPPQRLNLKQDYEGPLIFQSNSQALLNQGNLMDLGSFQNVGQQSESHLFQE